MCLGIPGKVVELYEENGLPMGTVDFGGVRKTICTAHVPELAVGDYTVVHVGFALSRIDEAEASAVFAMLEKMNELEDLQRGLEETP